MLTRGDYVTNSNDSYWLSNPDEPLTGYDRIIGDEKTARSLRTRSGIISVRDQLAKSKFTRADMQNLVFANRNQAGELAAASTVEMCRDMHLGEPCDVLAKWDRTANTDSRGPPLRPLLAQGSFRLGPVEDAVQRLRPSPHPTRLQHRLLGRPQGLIDAVDELRKSNILLDAPLGDHQYVTRNGEKIPLAGGTEDLGILNKIEAPWTPGKGYTEVTMGSSYIQVVSFDGDACPDTRTLLTYSQSADPTSPHYADQTRLFSKNQWVTERFCSNEIAKAPGLKVVDLTGSDAADPVEEIVEPWTNAASQSPSSRWPCSASRVQIAVPGEVLGGGARRVALRADLHER